LPARSPRRGDVVIFRSVENGTETVVKRCIGLPGDAVEIAAKQLYLNGQRLDESAYAAFTAAGEAASSPWERMAVHRRDNWGPETVPAGHYLMLGDNRDNSRDSRAWGPLPAHLIKGRALFIYWSNSGQTPDGKGQSLGQWLAHIAKTALGFFHHTRWERTLRLIR
jgi:signal peptidase I